MSSIHILDKNTELIKDYLTNKPNEKIVIEDKHVRNIENHTETFDFIVDLKASENINLKDRVIIPSENKGEYREFIVDDVDTDTFTGETEVRTTASYLELDKGYPIEPQTLSQNTAQQAVEFALNMVDWEVGEVEYSGIRTMNWTSYNSPYEVLKIIANRFDLQLDFTIETEGNKVTKRLVHLRSKEALFNGKEVSRGKDLSSLKVERQSADVVTALVALAPEPPEPEEGEEKQERLVIYLRDEEAQSKYGRGQDYLWSVYEPESQDDQMTEARLRTLATTELNKRKEAKIDYSIDAIDLEQFLGHEQVRIGDKIRIKDDLQEPYFYADAVVKEISRSNFNPLAKTYVLGEVVEYTREQLLMTWESFREYFSKRLQETQSRIDNIVTIIDTEVEKRIFRGATPPNNPINGQLWLDTSNPDKAVLKEYINGMWVTRIDNPSEEDIEAISRATAMYESIVSQLISLEALQMQLFTRANRVRDDEYLNDFHRNNLHDIMSAVIGTYNTLKTEVDKYKDSKKVTLQQANYIQQLMINYSNAMNELNTAIIEAENYALKHLEILQQQYTDEKFEAAVETTAERLGFIVEDGVIKIGEDSPLSGVIEIINENTEEQLKSVVRVSDYEADQAGIIERLDASDSERTQLSNQILDRVTLTDYTKDKNETTGKISTLETSIEQNGREIELKASQQDVDSVRKTLSDSTAAINVRADSIESNVRGLNDDLELTKSTIEQTSDNINLRINTLNIGGDNLIPKADFSLYNSPPEGWDSWGSGNYLNSLIRGNKVLLAQTPNPNDNANNATLGFQSPHLFKDVQEGKFYTLSWYANTSASFDSAFRYCFLMNPNGSNQNLPTPEIVSTGNSIGDMSQNFNQYKLTFKADFSGRAHVLIGGHYEANSYAFIYMSEPQLEEGEFATSFKASTAETIKQDNLVSSINLDTSGVKIQGAKVDINANDINLTANNSFNSLVTDVSKISSSIASGTVRYSGVDRTNWRDLIEADGSLFDDQYSYDVTAKVRGTNTDSVIVSLISNGSGNGWTISRRETNGDSSYRPDIYTTASGGVRIRTAGTPSSTYTMEVSYNKYIGTGTGMTWADSKITQTANNITSEVNKKTDTSQVQSMINQSASSITSTVRNEFNGRISDVNGKIDGLVIGGDNLIPKSNLPDDRSAWGTNYSRTGITHAASGTYPGWLWINFPTSATGGTGTGIGASTPRFHINEGEEYVLSFKAMNFINVDEDMTYLAWIVIDGSNRVIPNPTKKTKVGQIGGNDIYQYEVSTTTNFSGEAYIIINSRILNPNNAARFYLRDVTLQRGNVSGGWRPSSTDYIDEFSEIRQKANTIELEVNKKIDDTTARSLISQSATNINLKVDTAQNRADSAWSRAGTGISNAASAQSSANAADTKASNAATVAGRAEGKIDGLEVGADNLIPDSGWHKEPSGSYIIPNNWRNPVGGNVWGSRQGTYWLLTRVNHSSDGTSGSTTNSYYGVRSPQLLEPLVAGQEYTLTLKARNIAGNNYNFNYTYIINDASSNQRINLTRVKNVDNSGQLWTATFTANHSSTGHILFGHHGINGEYNAFYMKEPILTKGNSVTTWSDSIQNKPDKDKIITEINLTQDTAEISAQKIQLNGDLIKVNGQMRVGDLDFNRATATGGSGTSTLKMQGNMIELRGNYTRQWRGSTATENVYTVMEQGHMRFRNESRDRTLFYSDFGISTYADGRGANEDSSGTISFFDHTYSPTARGLLAHSTWGVVGLKSDNNRIILESGKENFVYVATPRMRIVRDPHVPDSYSDIQFSSAQVNNIRVNDERADLYLGVSTNELRVTNNLFWNGGNTGYRPIRVGSVQTEHSVVLASHSGGNAYIGVGSGSSQLRVTNNNGYNGGDTAYKQITAADFNKASSEKFKTEIEQWNYAVLDIIKNDIQLYRYKLKSEIDTEFSKFHHGVIIEREVPSEWINQDAISDYEMSSWMLKGIQELAHENDELKEKVSNLENEIQQIKEMLAK